MAGPLHSLSSPPTRGLPLILSRTRQGTRKVDHGGPTELGGLTISLALGRVQPSVRYVGMYAGASVPVQGPQVCPQWRTIATLPRGAHLREMLAREETATVLSGRILMV